MEKRLYIDDLSKLKVTKVKPFCIFFEYDGTKYMLHESSDGFDASVTLYKRDVSDKGYWELEPICSKFHSLEVDEYIRGYKKGFAYNHTRKDIFVKRLLAEGFTYGLFEEEYHDLRVTLNAMGRSISAVAKEMIKVEEEYWR